MGSESKCKRRQGCRLKARSAKHLSMVDECGKGGVTPAERGSREAGRVER